MKPIVEHDHGTWFEIETRAQAQEETDRMEHAVVFYFVADARTQEASGTKTYRYFSFREGDTSVVTARVPLAGVAETQGPIVVGRRNSDPYPDHGDAIEALAAAISTPLPDSCYPYPRRQPTARL